MKTFARLLLCAAAVVAADASAECTSATVNSGMPPRVMGLVQDGISSLLGCLPTVLEPTPGVPRASRIYTWGFADGVSRKQIAVQFDQAGLAASARYQEIPLLPGGSTRSDNSDLKAAAAIVLLAAGSALRSAAAAGAVCTPATINPAAVQMVRPHMMPQAVSGVLGCLPTEIPATGIGVWIWGVPLLDQVGAKMQVAVVFDELGAASAQYQFFPPAIPKPAGNGALRVEPPLPPFGNWVPGVGP